MERRDRNQVVVEARRLETMGGMIGNLIASGEQIREKPSLKGDHDRRKCQDFQLIRVFGTDNGGNPCTRGGIDAEPGEQLTKFPLWDPRRWPQGDIQACALLGRAPYHGYPRGPPLHVDLRRQGQLRSRRGHPLGGLD
jgi:hypothetical protein